MPKKISEKGSRPLLSNAGLALASHEVMAKISQALDIKGYGAWQSSHEILGIIAEEYTELIEAVKLNDIDQVHKELQDIAAAAQIGIACINQKTLDW